MELLDQMIIVFWSPDVNSQFIREVPVVGKDWGKKEKRVSEDEMAGWHHQCNGHEPGQTSGDGEGQGGLGVTKSQTQLSDWTATTNGTVFLIWGRISVVFSIVAASITFPPPVYYGSLFLYIRTNICYLLSFWYTISLPVYILKTLLISSLLILFRGLSY